MSSEDDQPTIESGETSATSSARTTDSYLLETLMIALIEKGLLSKNDVLSVVETVAEVERGELHNARDGSRLEIASSLRFLSRLYASFEAIDVTPVALTGDNIVSLRPPLHDDTPRFPNGN